jgi:hypothetical protein
MFVERLDSHSWCKQKMMSFKVQASLLNVVAPSVLPKAVYDNAKITIVKSFTVKALHSQHFFFFVTYKLDQ